MPITNEVLIPWHEFDLKAWSAVLGAVLGISVILHSISFALLILWIGGLGSFTSFHLIKWRLNTTSQLCTSTPISKCQPHKSIPDIDSKAKESGEVCIACKKSGCHLHVSQASTDAFQPWNNLTVPKKVDAALADLLCHVLNRFVYTWYTKITQEEDVVDELRVALRFLVCKLLIRVQKVDLAEFISTRLAPDVVTHLVQHVHSYRKVGRFNGDRIRLHRTRVHRSLYNREDEFLYLKQLVNNLFPYILPENVQHCRSLRLLLEELLAGVVLLPVADKIADPDTVNNLLVIFFDETPAPVNPDLPTEKVEILASFSSPNSSFQPIHHHDLGKVVSHQSLLACFIDVMKKNGGLKFLQFFLTLDHFKKKLLLPAADREKLQDDAVQMYNNFCKDDAYDYVDLGTDLLSQFKQLSEGGMQAVEDLETNGEFLSRTYDYLYNLMESYYLPMLLHSSQYFTHLYGEKDAKLETFTRASKGERKSFSLSAKIRGSFKGEKLGARSSSCNSLKDLDPSSGPPTPDGVSLHDEDVVDESVLEELHDLNDWVVEIPSISIQLDPNGTADKPSNFFQVKVYKNTVANAIGEPDVGPRIRTGCSVFRTYNDFYNLEQKLKQFHGDKLNVQLPPLRRHKSTDHEYLDKVRPSFEAYLKNLLNITDLRNSELLYNFLTIGDFSISSIFDIGIESVLKSVPGKLVKEKGQNLKSFMKTLQHSTVDKTPRPDLGQAAKLSEERLEKSPFIVRHLHNPLYQKSHIRQPSNGVAVEPNNHLLTAGSRITDHSVESSTQPVSLVDCVVRIAEEVLLIPKTLHWILSTLVLVGKSWMDTFITWYIGVKLGQVQEEHRIEGLVNLLRDNLFYGDGSTRTLEQKERRRIQALSDLKNFPPGAFKKLFGEDSFNASLEEMFEVLQHPKLNKQLVYILLDTIVSQLFPELTENGTRT